MYVYMGYICIICVWHCLIHLVLSLSLSLYLSLSTSLSLFSLSFHPHSLSISWSGVSPSALPRSVCLVVSLYRSSPLSWLSVLHCLLSERAPTTFIGTWPVSWRRSGLAIPVHIMLVGGSSSGVSPFWCWTRGHQLGSKQCPHCKGNSGISFFLLFLSLSRHDVSAFVLPISYNNSLLKVLSCFFLRVAHLQLLLFFCHMYSLSWCFVCCLCLSFSSRLFRHTPYASALLRGKFGCLTLWIFSSFLAICSAMPCVMSKLPQPSLACDLSVEGDLGLQYESIRLLGGSSSGVSPCWSEREDTNSDPNSAHTAKETAVSVSSCCSCLCLAMMSLHFSFSHLVNIFLGCLHLCLFHCWSI